MTTHSQDIDELNEAENEINTEGRLNLTSNNSTNTPPVDSLAHKVQFVEDSDKVNMPNGKAKVTPAHDPCPWVHVSYRLTTLHRGP